MGQRLSIWEAFDMYGERHVFTYDLPLTPADPHTHAPPARSLASLMERWYAPDERARAWDVVATLNGLDPSSPAVRVQAGDAQPASADGVVRRRSLTLPLRERDLLLNWERHVVSHDTFADLCKFLREDPLRVGGTGDLEVDPAWYTEAFLWETPLNAAFRDAVLAAAHQPLDAAPEAPGRLRLPWRDRRLYVWIPTAQRCVDESPARVRPTTLLSVLVGSAKEVTTLSLRPVTTPEGTGLLYDARDWVRRYGSHDRRHGGWLCQIDSTCAYLEAAEQGEGCLKTCQIMLGERIHGSRTRGLANVGGEGTRVDVTAGASGAASATEPATVRAPANAMTREVRAQREDADGHVIPDASAYRAMVEYLNDQLSAGHPVIVGVTFYRDSDAVKDHYVVIVAHGRDSDGLYWIYYDPAVGRDRGPSLDNRLRLQPAVQAAGTEARPGVLYIRGYRGWGGSSVPRVMFYEVCEYYLNRAELPDFERWGARDRGDIAHPPPAAPPQ